MKKFLASIAAMLLALTGFAQDDVTTCHTPAIDKTGKRKIICRQNRNALPILLHLQYVGYRSFLFHISPINKKTRRRARHVRSSQVFHLFQFLDNVCALRSAHLHIIKHFGNHDAD